MANRYWRGTTSTDWHNVNNWSDTSGGATPATALPTSADDVYFNNLGNLPCIVTAAANCKTFTQTSGYTAQFDHDKAINVYGSLSMNSSINYKGDSIYGGWYFRATNTGHTINSGGETLHNMTFDGVGGGWTLSAALTLDTSFSHIVFNNGTFNSGGFAISTRFIAAGSGVAAGKTITLTNSTITLTASGINQVNFVTYASQIASLTCTNTHFIVTGTDGAAYFGSGVTIGPFQAILLTGNMTLNVGTSSTIYVGPSAAGQFFAALSLDCNVTATEFYTANTVTDHTATRLHVCSSVKGTQRTLSIGTFGIFGTPSRNIDWEDIAVTGAASPLPSGTQHVNCGNSTGINPRTATTYYATRAAGNFSNPAIWSYSNGGAAANSVPTAQDGVFLTGLSPAGTYTIDVGRIGTLHTSSPTTFTRTLAYTGAHNLSIYGAVTLNSSLTWTCTGTGIVKFRPVVGAISITSGGKSWAQNIYFEGDYAGIQDSYLVDNFYTTATFYHNSGTLSLNTKNLACAAYNATTNYGANSAYLQGGFSSSTLTVTGTGTVVNMQGAGFGANLTNVNIAVNDTSATQKNIFFNGQTLKQLTLGAYSPGNCIYYLAGSPTITTLYVNKSVACTVILEWFFNVYTFGSIIGSGSAGNLITLKPSGAAGNTVALNPITGATPIVLQYWELQGIFAGYNGYAWYGGSLNPLSENQIHVYNGTDSGYNNGSVKFMPRDVYRNALSLLGAGT